MLIYDARYRSLTIQVFAVLGTLLSITQLLVYATLARRGRRVLRRPRWSLFWEFEVGISEADTAGSITISVPASSLESTPSADSRSSCPGR